MIAGLSDAVETGLEVNRHGIEVFSDPRLLYSSRMSELFEVKSSPHGLRDGVIDSACWSEVLVLRTARTAVQPHLGRCRVVQ